jgi:putative copper export protein
MAETVSLLAPIVRGLILVALLMLVGTAVSIRIVSSTAIPAGSEEEVLVSGWLRRLPGLFAWFLLSLWLVRGALQVLSFSDPGQPIDPELARFILSEGSWGLSWLSGAALAFILLALGWSLRNSPSRLGLLVGVASAGLLLAQAGMGHAADPFWEPAPLGRAIHFVHLLGAGVWVGTLAILALAVFPSLPVSRHELVARVLDRFSTFARIGAGLIVISGVIAALVYTNTISDLWSSTWGKLLLAKLAAVAVVALAGYRNWRVITPAVASGSEGARDELRRAISLELLFAAIVIAITAVLGGTGTPRE